MLKKGLYLYAMMIFCFTALQAVDEIPVDFEQTIVKGKCPCCPRNSSSSNDEANFVAIVEDDNAELESEEGKSFSVAIEDENNPHSIKDTFACKGKNRKNHKRNPVESIVNEHPEMECSFLVCGDEESEEITILPFPA